jgi:hypothetical protein
MELALVVLFTMLLTQLLKVNIYQRVLTEENSKIVTIITVMVIAGTLNGINAAVFGTGITLVEAIKLGIMEGAVASGAYSWLKAILPSQEE